MEITQPLKKLSMNVHSEKMNEGCFDYTKWRENQYNNMNLSELLDYASLKIEGYSPSPNAQII
jgi:hypothetical protein